MTEISFYDKRVNTYTHNDGVVMDSPLAPPMSELYMSAIENHFLKNKKTKKCPTEYIHPNADDIFVVINNIENFKKI